MRPAAGTRTRPPMYMAAPGERGPRWMWSSEASRSPRSTIWRRGSRDRGSNAPAMSVALARTCPRSDLEFPKFSLAEPVFPLNPGRGATDRRKSEYEIRHGFRRGGPTVRGGVEPGIALTSVFSVTRAPYAAGAGCRTLWGAERALSTRTAARGPTNASYSAGRQTLPARAYSAGARALCGRAHSAGARRTNGFRPSWVRFCRYRCPIAATPLPCLCR
jgi:hypothetical protein